MYCKFDDVVIVHIVGTNWNPDNGKQEVIIAIEKTGFYSLRSNVITWEALNLLPLARWHIRVNMKSGRELGISVFNQCGRVGQ